MTNYVILKQADLDTEGGADWIQGPTVEALSDEAAIRKAVDGDQGGTFVAVPIRSFRKRTVSVQTQRKISLS